MRLGHDYSEALGRLGTVTGDIDGSQPRELFFLITFEDSNSVFLMTSAHTTISWHNDILSKRIDDRFLLYPIPNRTEILLRLGDKVSRYNLRINAYDDIELHPVRRTFLH